jgi:histidinol-phosphate aminotransferase
LASNENPLGPSPKALTAAVQALQKSHVYPDGSCYELKNSLAHFLNVKSDQLTIGNGSENILELIIKSYLYRGDSAVISEYAFLTIPILLAGYGVTIKTAKAIHWGHDVDNLINAIDDKTRILFLVNPNNPTGTYTNKDDFENLLKKVPPHILIVVDEAYSEYINTDDYPDTLSYLTHYPNLIITRTFSKAYGLAALRLGYAVSSPAIADILNRARLPFNVNAIAAAAACAALSDQEHVAQTISINRIGLKQMADGLKILQLNYISSIANFITVDVDDGRDIYQKLLHQGVIVRPLHAYNMPKHIRVTIGTAEQNERFLTAINKVMT